MIVSVLARTSIGVSVQRRGGGSMVAVLLPGFVPAVGDLGWLEGGTLYPLPGGVSWSARLQAANASLINICLLSPGDSYTLEDATLGTAGAHGALIEVPAGVPIRNSGSVLGEVTVPVGTPIASYRQGSSITLYSRGGEALLLEPSMNRVVSV